MHLFNPPLKRLIPMAINLRGGLSAMTLNDLLAMDGPSVRLQLQNAIQSRVIRELRPTLNGRCSSTLADGRDLHQVKLHHNIWDCVITVSISQTQLEGLLVLQIDVVVRTRCFRPVSITVSSLASCSEFNYENSATRTSQFGRQAKSRPTHRLMAPRLSSSRAQPIINPFDGGRVIKINCHFQFHNPFAHIYV